MARCTTASLSVNPDLTSSQLNKRFQQIHFTDVRIPVLKGSDPCYKVSFSTQLKPSYRKQIIFAEKQNTIAQNYTRAK